MATVSAKTTGLESTATNIVATVIFYARTEHAQAQVQKIVLAVLIMRIETQRESAYVMMTLWAQSASITTVTVTLSARTVSCQVRPDVLIVCHMQQQSTENVFVTPTGQAKTALDTLAPALILVMAVPDLLIKSVFSVWQTHSAMLAEFVSAVQDGM